MAIGVGIIGAGPGVSALHLPTLARLAGEFEVVHIADAGSGRAALLAQRIGARASTGIDELLADPRVEAVAICSPPAEHAEQVRRAVAAHKRAILCEKPLALGADEAASLVDACRNAGVALVVGTNHLFDPAWTRAKHHLVAGRRRVRTVAVTLALPPNGRYHELVTETAGLPPTAGRPRPDLADPEVAASVVRQLILGLGVHDLPMLRDVAPRLTRVVYARVVPPVGYAIGLDLDGVLAQLNAVMLAAGPDALWRMSIGTTDDTLDVEFPPAFVHAGSATARVREGDGRVTEYRVDEVDGYIAEWRALAAALDGVAPVEYDELLEDARFAIAIADAAADAVRAGMRS